MDILKVKRDRETNEIVLIGLIADSFVKITPFKFEDEVSAEEKG